MIPQVAASASSPLAALTRAMQRKDSGGRGFRNFQNYRIRILFLCGKLNLYPL